MKTCCKCKLEKNESEFYQKTKDRLQSYCKPCLLKVQMLRWKKVKERAIEYKGGKCLDCEVAHNRPEVYQFHHLNPEEKDSSWDKLRLKSWDKIVAEIDKCVLLCANCHIIRHSKLIEDYK